MESTLPGPRKPKFRDAAVVAGGLNSAAIELGGQRCSFDYAAEEGPSVSRLLEGLRAGGLTVKELMARSPEIKEKIEPLLDEFNRLRLLTESDSEAGGMARSGAQLYREVHRLADRTLARVGRSSFLRALEEDRATHEHLVGYALEYHWIVKEAPALIAPALATAHTPKARLLLQNFLRSELGHDRFLAAALAAVGVTSEEMELHQPLPATFSLCAALGVYARQHALSFNACLFLFERAQPEFVEAFEERCRDLGLPEAFHAPLRAHAAINDEHDHEDISRALMELDTVVDAESCSIVKRHVSIMVETMVQQEEDILAYWSAPRARIPRLFGRRDAENIPD